MYSRESPSIVDYRVKGDPSWHRITSQSGAAGTKCTGGPKGEVPFACMKAHVSFDSQDGWRGAGVISALAKTEGGDTEGAKSGCSGDDTALDGTSFPDEQQGAPVSELSSRDQGELPSRLGRDYVLTCQSGQRLVIVSRYPVDRLCMSCRY